MFSIINLFVLRSRRTFMNAYSIKIPFRKLKVLWINLTFKFPISQELDINLKLISCEKVNEQGTLITKYLVVKNV